MKSIRIFLKNAFIRADIFCWQIANFIFRLDRNGLKQAYANYFLIGAAIDSSVSETNRKAIRILRQHFNSVTPVNCLKITSIKPDDNVFRFKEGDDFVKFGKRNGFTLIGHSLIWCYKSPKWMFYDSVGGEILKEELAKRMKSYIFAVANRYGKNIKVWEVLNEAIKNDGSYYYCNYLKILGEDYIKLAFRYAREALPNAKLYYNDYNLSMENRRNGVVNMIKSLQAEGIQIDGISLQCHCHLGFPDIKELEKSIIAFSQCGCKISISELDISVLPVVNPLIDPAIAISPAYRQSLNPYVKGLPDKIAKMQAEKYKNLFRLFLKHSDKIERVTFWGIADDMSGKNNFPIPGRTDYPLLFDRKYRAKPVVKELIGMGHS
jgi:endo-1,4-beta-xylanase